MQNQKKVLNRWEQVGEVGGDSEKEATKPPIYSEIKDCNLNELWAGNWDQNGLKVMRK